MTYWQNSSVNLIPFLLLIDKTAALTLFRFYYLLNNSFLVYNTFMIMYTFQSLELEKNWHSTRREVAIRSEVTGELQHQRSVRKNTITIEIFPKDNTTKNKILSHITRIWHCSVEYYLNRKGEP